MTMINHRHVRMPDGSVRVEAIPMYGQGTIVNVTDNSKVTNGTEHQSTRTTEVTKGADVVEYRKWIKFGNTAIRIDEHLYEVRMTMANANKELYPSEAAWRESIKKNMALELAQEIIKDMTFMRTDDKINDTCEIVGSAVVFNLNEIKLYMESTVPAAT